MKPIDLAAKKFDKLKNQFFDIRNYLEYLQRANNAENLFA